MGCQHVKGENQPDGTAYVMDRFAYVKSLCSGSTLVIVHPSPPEDSKCSVNDVTSPVVNRVKEEELLNLKQEPNYNHTEDN